MDGQQPGPPIAIAQGEALGHLVDIAFGMEIVAVVEGPAQTLGHQPADGGLAGSGNAHEDDDSGGLARGGRKAFGAPWLEK